MGLFVSRWADFVGIKDPFSCNLLPMLSLCAFFLLLGSFSSFWYHHHNASLLVFFPGFTLLSLFKDERREKETHTKTFPFSWSPKDLNLQSIFHSSFLIAEKAFGSRRKLYMYAAFLQHSYSSIITIQLNGIKCNSTVHFL